jgi:hypothetical protein
LKPNLNLELETLEKRNRKRIRKSREKEKGKAAQQPSSAQPGRAPTLPDRWDPPISESFLSHFLSLSLSLSARWGRPVGASCFPLCAPLPSLPRGPVLPGAEPLPRAPLFSLYVVDPPCQFRPPRTRRGPARAHRACRRNSRPRYPPTHPSSLLEPRQRLHSLPHLISHSFALSRALPTPPDADGDPRPLPRPSSSLETVPSHPELHPEVRHLCPC